MTREDGSVVSIVYRNGGLVDAEEVNDLCTKVTSQPYHHKQKAEIVCRLSLYGQVQWPRRQIEKLAVALEKSYLVCHIHLCIAYPDEEGIRKRLIGVARATSDHAFNATIWDLVIDPEYQGRGLGIIACPVLNATFWQ